MAAKWARAEHSVANHPTADDVRISWMVFLFCTCGLWVMALGVGVAANVWRIPANGARSELVLLAIAAVTMVAVNALELDSDLLLDAIYVTSGIIGASALWKLFGEISKGDFWQAAHATLAFIASAILGAFGSWWNIYAF
jgi:hypothetical protein